MTLTEALEGLTEDRFCTGALARDCAGKPTIVFGREATRWCVRGWFYKHMFTYEIHQQAARCAQALGYPRAHIANDVLGYKFVEKLRNWENQK